ncbi:MAG: hypothetical protein AAFS11_08975 [Planctomycetota bacterium]
MPMRLLLAINRICYGSCLLAIVGGAFITVAAIWLEQEAVGWKGVSTAAVLIFAAVLVLATNSIIGSKVMTDAGGIADFLPIGHRGDRPAIDAPRQQPRPSED